MSNSPSTAFVVPAAATSTSTEAQGSAYYPIGYQVQATPLHPLPPTRGGRILSCLRGLPFFRKIAAMKQKLPLLRDKKPIPVDQLAGQQTLVSKPIIGGSKDQPPEVSIVSIAPGTWHGESATMILLEYVYSPDPSVPKVSIDVHVKADSDDHSQAPSVVGWGPARVISEQQDLEHTRGLKGAANLGAQAGLADAEVNLEGHNDTVQYDTVRGHFTSRPKHRAAAGYSGVNFVFTGPKGSKHGVPAWVRLAVVYKFDRAVRLEVDLDVKETLRRFCPAGGEHESVVWDQGREYRYSGLPCPACKAGGSEEPCREFSHADEAFWFSLLNKANLRYPRFLPFVETKDTWFATQ